jgi:peptidoglycan/xylan/chitin deacetylase (PgdA/CDA1 family)
MKRRWWATTLAIALGASLAVAAPGRAEPAGSADPDAVVVAPASTLPVVYRVDTNDPVVFITIDDGIVRSRDALKWLQRKRLPVTSFLTTSVARGHYRYFEKMSARGSLQNHTVSHPAFDTFGGSLTGQICPVQREIGDRTGTQPWMLRPPYGAGPRLSRVHQAAASCGITHIVMWDAVVDRGRLTTWNGRQLSRGSIMLLHYTPNLKQDLRVAYRAARDQGFTVAALEDYLPGP